MATTDKTSESIILWLNCKNKKVWLKLFILTTFFSIGLTPIGAKNTVPTISGNDFEVTKIGNIYYIPTSSINSKNNIIYDPKGQIVAGYSSGRQMWELSSSNVYWLRFTLNEVYSDRGGAAVKTIKIHNSTFDFPVQKINNYDVSKCIKCPDWNTETLFSYNPYLKISTTYYPYKVSTLNNSNQTGLITDIAADTYLQFYTPDFDTTCTAPNKLISIETGTSTVLRWEYSTDNGFNWKNIENNLPYYYEKNPTQGDYLYRALINSLNYSTIKHVHYVDSLDSKINISANSDSLISGDSLLISVPFSQNFKYQWYKSNAILTNETSNVFYVKSVTPHRSGDYSCKISNKCNTVTSDVVSITVNKAPQTIDFPDIPTKTYGDEPFTLPATTSIGSTIIYQNTNNAVATISGNTVTILSPGTTNIIASHPGSGSVLPATTVTKTLTVIKSSQSIDLSTTAIKTYGDAAFILPAVTDKNKTITYLSNNTSVATISGNKVTIRGAGTANIIANQPGDSYYNAAPSITQLLTVNKATLTATADSKTRIYGDANPTLTISYSGFVNGDNHINLVTQPVATTTATNTSNSGTYNISISTINDPNYILTINDGILTINKAPLEIGVNNDSVIIGETMPAFKLVYSGFKNNDNASNLDTLPTISCAATNTLIPGTYDIVLSGGFDKNYLYNLSNGEFVIRDNTGLNDLFSSNISLYPSPTNSKIFFKSDVYITKVDVYSIDGRLVLQDVGFENESIDLSKLMNGSYLLRLHSISGVITKMVIKH